MTEGVAWAAAALQVPAYGMYLRRAWDGRIDPNPTSWLMWAYETALVVALEADQGIRPALCLLPAACAACSVAVALLCWRRGSLRWPRERGDRVALGIDLATTGAYAAVSLGAVTGSVSWAAADAGRAIVLVCLSVGAVASYVPILRSTRRRPEEEDPVPWLVWTVAYALLLIATIDGEGASPGTVRFWVYPAINAGLSAAVAGNALRAGRLHRSRAAVTS